MRGLLICCVVTIILPASTAFWGCSEIPEGHAVLQLEYDHVDDCHIFPDSSLGRVDDAFGSANTQLMVYYGNSWAADFYVDDVTDLERLAQDYAEEYNGSRVYPLYLASVNRGYGGFVGVTLNSGRVYEVICAVFYDDIDDRAEQYPDVPFSDLRDGVVTHELGHGRANLSHLCDGYMPVTAEHDDPSPSATCIMADSLLDPPCMEEGDRPPLDYITFCGKCDSSLNQVTW